MKVPNPPESGKDTAKAKSVHREVKFEERRRQISGLTNRNLIRLYTRIRLPYKSKSNSCTELYAVDGADIWRERMCEYLERSCQQKEIEYETCSNNEWQEVSRGHCTKRLQTQGD